MKAGNIILSIIALLIGGFVWMLMDDGKASPAATTGGSLGAALKSSRPVLVEFYADWCGPCRMVGPYVDKLAVELKGRAEVVRVNVDQHREAAQKFGVEGIPCFIAFKNGKETSRQVGGIPPQMMKSMLGL